MGRDFEITSYFPHQELTRRLVRRLFGDLADAGLRVGTADADDYPTLAWLRPQGRGVRITTPDVEDLLRSRGGRLPRGYGVVPLLGSVPGLGKQATGELQFSVHSPVHPALDGLHLRFDDATLRPEPPDPSLDSLGPGWRRLLTWYEVICESLRVAYSYGDWEDRFLQSVIPPSRRDVLEGRVELLFRLNCLGPALVSRLGRERVHSVAAQAVVALRYGGVLIGGKLSYESPDDAQFRATAAHLGMRV